MTNNASDTGPDTTYLLFLTLIHLIWYRVENLLTVNESGDVVQEVAVCDPGSLQMSLCPVLLHVRLEYKE